nr:cytochrome c oxidase assembly factor 3, mitochondrial-like [Lepeophtheirus salmonis]
MSSMQRILRLRAAPLRILKRSKSMKQVNVDDLETRAKLGSIQMDFIQKAEKMNSRRASQFSKYRRQDLIVGGVCFTMAISIYLYTIFAIKQEQFLDDFEMPDPMLPVQKSSKE